MPDFFKRVAVDAYGNAGSILGPLRQKSFPDQRTLLRQAGEIDDSPEQKVEKTDSKKYAAQETSTTSSTERGKDDKATHIVAPLFVTSHDDVNSLEHTVFPLPPDSPEQEVEKTDSKYAAQATFTTSSTERGKDDKATPDQADCDSSESSLQNVPLTESVESSGNERPDITSYSGKEDQVDQKHLSANTTSSKTGNRESSVPETVKESRLRNQTLTGKPLKTKLDSDKVNVMTIALPNTRKDNVDMQAVDFNQASVYSRNDQEENPFHDSGFQSEAGLTINSREPLVHIGQIDVIIEAQADPSSNKAARPMEVNQSLNPSASFLRRL